MLENAKRNHNCQRLAMSATVLVATAAYVQNKIAKKRNKQYRSGKNDCISALPTNETGTEIDYNPQPKKSKTFRKKKVAA